MRRLLAFVFLAHTAMASTAPFTVTWTAPVAGTYPIWHRVISPNSNSDSWLVSMNGGAQFIDDNCEKRWPCDGTFWTPLTNRTATGGVESQTPYAVTLAAGQMVTLAFAVREPNTQLVEIKFGDPFATPTPTPAPTVTPTFTPTVTPTLTPTLTPTATPGGPFEFYAVEPCRAFDPAPASFTLRGVCGVPVTAKSVVIAVTVTAPTATGSYTLETFPAVQFVAGETQTNSAVVKPDLTPFFSAGTGQVAIDVYGYFQ